MQFEREATEETATGLEHFEDRERHHALTRQRTKGSIATDISESV